MAVRIWLLAIRQWPFLVLEKCYTFYAIIGQSEDGQPRE